MTTKTQIARLAARIDDLAQRADARPAIAFVWQDEDETEEQALARHRAERPEASRAKRTHIFTWSGRRPGAA